MDMLENTPLRHLNTFGIECRARYLATITADDDLRAVRNHGIFRSCDRLVLGGGSNVLFCGDYDGLILLNKMAGRSVIDENEDWVWVNVAGGENWHQLVTWCVEQGWGGIENLALIPGSVGASPIQNIGAYGVELRDVFVSLEAFFWETGETRVFYHDDCRFGYRDSVFKNELKGQVFITSVTLRLSRRPRVNTAYGNLAALLAERGIARPGIRDVYQAVMDIRQSKLPDPAVTGNAGSFFKNPELPVEQARAILEKHPSAPHFAVNENTIKIPAGWLIEQCGWKGRTEGRAGVHEKQALVLVNRGGASGEEIRSLAYKIMDSVRETFGVELQPEVNIIG